MRDFQVIDVVWKVYQDRAAWEFIKDSKKLSLAIPISSLADFPRILRGPNIGTMEAQEQFAQALHSSDFLKLWGEVCGHGQTIDTVFHLRNFPPNAWNIPWELLIGELNFDYNRPATSIVRSTKKTSLSPTLLGEPMRVLILKGDDTNLQITREVRQIEKAYQRLPKAAKQRIEEPSAENASRENLVALLNQYKPNILWFAGHGRINRESNIAELKFKDSWIAVTEFVTLIRKANLKSALLYAVFWACELGQPDYLMDVEFAYSPLLVQSLQEIGVQSVLVMQSPIGDRNAIDLSEEIFIGLVSGFSLVKALAHARANLYLKLHRQWKDSYPDWAVPVLWSAGKPVAELTWNIGDERLIQLQVLTRKIDEIQNTGLESDIAKEFVRTLGNLWLTEKPHKIWVKKSDVVTSDYKVLWSNVLKLILEHSECFIIHLDLSNINGTAEEQLSKWASQVLEILQDDTNLPVDFGETLAGIKGQQRAAWERLLKYDNLFLSIVSPPQLEDESWFWQTLISSSENNYVCILAEWDPPQNSKWVIESIEMMFSSSEIQKIVNSAPRLTRALAILDIPLGVEFLQLGPRQDEVEVTSLELLYGNELIMVKTEEGYYMRSAARGYALTNATPEQMDQAHFDCVQILWNPKLHNLMLRNERLREHRLEHLLKSGRAIGPLIEKVMNEFDYLLRRYEALNRPYEVIRLTEVMLEMSEAQFNCRLPRSSFSEHAQLTIVSAYLQSGNITEAEKWLNSCDPSQEINEARLYWLKAEIYKSGGYIEAKRLAREAIEQAISVCDAQLNSSLIQMDDELQRKLTNMRLNYRQDRARILYFFPSRPEDMTEAKTEYELIMQNANGSLSDTELAIVERNYAECLRKLPHRSSSDLQTAARYLRLAEEHAGNYPIRAEIIYEQSKIAEETGNLKEVASRLEECRRIAELGHYYMISTIARNRLFWLRLKQKNITEVSDMLFSDWESIESSLENYPSHGWAVRTVVDTRLKMAKLLEPTGNLFDVVDLLNKNKRDLDRNPSFNTGSDRRRIAMTYAGLHLCGYKGLGSMVDYWSEWLQFPWVQGWLLMMQLANPEEIWDLEID